MTTTLTSNAATNTPCRSTSAWLDLTAGAGHFCLRQPVQLHRRLVDHYAEPDPALGLNVSGVILSSLLWRNTQPDDQRGDVLVAVLRRKLDGRLVHVFLAVTPFTTRGQSGLSLKFTAERELTSLGGAAR